jgi:hypothetical protein
MPAGFWSEIFLLTPQPAKCPEAYPLQLVQVTYWNHFNVAYSERLTAVPTATLGGFVFV